MSPIWLCLHIEGGSIVWDSYNKIPAILGSILGPCVSETPM